jgi:arylsulfatase A-like enzyme
VIRRAAVVATLTLAPMLAIPARASAQGDRPDVLLVVTDDQRSDSLWAMPVVSNRLAAEGVTLSDAFVVNPLCCPSRASILTGVYAHTHLVYRQTPPFGRFEWFEDDSTLATWLDAAGYATGLFGKYLDGYQHAALTGYVPPGWDRWVGFVRSAPLGYALTVDGSIVRPAAHSTDVLADEAVRFIQAAEGPLFLVYAPASPHAPATPLPEHASAFGDLVPDRPPSFDEIDVSDKPAWVRALPRMTLSQEAAVDELRRREYRSLLGVDAAVGRILDALAAEGRLETTIVIYTSDNGLLHGEHRWTRKEAPYEEAIRVPMVVRWDVAGWERGSELGGPLALNVDLAPTIAEATGIAAPPMEGASLLPLLRDPTIPWRSDFLVEHLEGTNPVPTYCAVRSERWMYVRYATDEEELYDLTSDPFELENLAADPGHDEVLADRRARLRELCVPPPPAYRDDSSTTVPVALLALAVLIGLEIRTSRRSKPTEVAR